MADIEKEATAAAVAVASPAENSGTPMWQQEKKGAKCCGCCCDYRRATITIAIIFIILGVITVVAALAASASLSVFALDDDEAVAIMEDSQKTSTILSAVSLLAWICALAGAMKYSVPLIAINVVYMVISCVVQNIITSGMFNDIQELEGAAEVNPPIAQYGIQVAILLLFIYPQAGKRYVVVLFLGVTCFKNLKISHRFCYQSSLQLFFPQFSKK